MSRFAVIGLSLAFIGIVAGATLKSDEALAGAACHRTTFQTKLIENACTKGGQGAAKKAMKKFLKKAKKTESGLECKGCHKTLAPNYDLKDDGFDHFKKLGGK